jgi:alkaline phosphatase D
MPAEDVEVRWRVAEDEKMTKVVAEGKTVANPEWAHSVHVEVEGLRPDRWYWYQFHAGSADSPIGRSRTMPAADAMPDRLRFAFASCQHFEAGHYTAYEHMARQDVDVVFHLGDYIYEGAAREKQPRKHVGKKLFTLEDYRNRLAQYKTDPALQKMHAAAPWIVTWDDHEVENNYAGGISERKIVDPQKFLEQRAAAYKAYYEHMPLRRAALPKGPDMTLYRGLSFGRLASFLSARYSPIPVAANLQRTPHSAGRCPCRDSRRPNAAGDRPARLALPIARQIPRHVERARAANHDGSRGPRARGRRTLRDGPMARV